MRTIVGGLGDLAGEHTDFARLRTTNVSVVDEVKSLWGRKHMSERKV